MSKIKKGYNKTYPEEKEGNLRETNRKLKSQIKHLNKMLKQLESENQTLQRAFSKSIDFIKNKNHQKSLEQVLNDVESYEYKETEKGRERVKEEKIENATTQSQESCPKCGKKVGDGFAVLKFPQFCVHSCSCGYKARFEIDDKRIARSCYS